MSPDRDGLGYPLAPVLLIKLLLVLVPIPALLFANLVPSLDQAPAHRVSPHREIDPVAIQFLVYGNMYRHAVYASVSGTNTRLIESGPIFLSHPRHNTHY
jgi:hypothetical protein